MVLSTRLLQIGLFRQRQAGQHSVKLVQLLLLRLLRHAAPSAAAASHTATAEARGHGRGQAEINEGVQESLGAPLVPGPSTAQLGRNRSDHSGTGLPTSFLLIYSDLNMDLAEIGREQHFSQCTCPLRCDEKQALSA